MWDYNYGENRGGADVVVLSGEGDGDFRFEGQSKFDKILLSALVTFTSFVV